MAKRARIGRYLYALENGDVKVRREAALKLGKASYYEAVGPLCNALQKDSSWYVRRNAARALGRIRSAEAVEALCVGLTDTTTSVRREAATALGKIGDVRAVDALCRLLNERKESVRESVLMALCDIGPVAIVTLCRRLTDPQIPDYGHALTPLFAIVTNNGVQTLYVIVSAEALTPEQRWMSLSLLRDMRSRWFLLSELRRQLSDLRRFCENAAQSEDRSVSQGARALLEYTTLARASQRSLTTQHRELLRGAHDFTAKEQGGTLLRASEISENSTEDDPASTSRSIGGFSLIGLLRRWFRRR